MPMGTLDGRVALITAAGSGMGRATAQALATEGATVYATDLRGDTADETVAAIEAAGGKGVARALNVTDLDAVKALIDEIGSAHGRLHILHNHAGSPGPSGLAAPAAEWDLLVDLNLKSA